MIYTVIEAYILSYLPWSIAIPSIALITCLSFLYHYNKKRIMKRLEPYKKWINRTLIGVSIVLCIFIAFVVGVYVGSYGEKLEVVQKNSLQVACDYDFEDISDPTDISPWTKHPKNKSYEGLISEEKKHFGNASLRLIVDMKDYEYTETKKDEYGCIGITSAKLSEVKAIKAWVLVPISEQVRGITFSSHIIAYFNDPSSRNIEFFGETEEIKPGTWTPIFLGVFYEANCSDPNIEWNCNFEWDGTIDALYLTVWSDKPYKGSIYFDDITIWK